MSTDGRNGGLRRGLIEAEILGKSAELFAECGFAGTSMQDIADALGTSRPALYHYFSSKDEILDRLVQELADSAEKALSIAADIDGPPDQRLVGLIRSLVTPIAESPSRFRLVFNSDGAPNQRTRARLRDLEPKIIHAVRSVIEDGMASGQFRNVDPRTATFAVLGMMHWIAWWYTPTRDVATEELGDVIAEMALASLAVQGKRNQPSVKDSIAAIRRELTQLERSISSENSHPR